MRTICVSVICVGLSHTSFSCTGIGVYYKPLFMDDLYKGIGVFAFSWRLKEGEKMGEGGVPVSRDIGGGEEDGRVFWYAGTSEERARKFCSVGHEILEPKTKNT